MACSFYVKKDDKEVAHFVTWSGLTKHVNKADQMNHFSSKRFGEHSASIDSKSTVETFGHFLSFPAGSIFVSLSSKKFLIALKTFTKNMNLPRTWRLIGLLGLRNLNGN